MNTFLASSINVYEWVIILSPLLIFLTVLALGVIICILDKPEDK